MSFKERGGLGWVTDPVFCWGAFACLYVISKICVGGRQIVGPEGGVLRVVEHLLHFSF